MTVRIYLIVLAHHILLTQLSCVCSQKIGKSERDTPLHGTNSKIYFSSRNSEQSSNFQNENDAFFPSQSSTDFPQTTPGKAFKDFLKFLDRCNIARLRRANEDEKTKLVVDLDKNEVNVRGKKPSKAVHVWRIVEEDGVVVEIPKSLLTNRLGYSYEDINMPSNEEEYIRFPMISKNYLDTYNESNLPRRICVRNILTDKNLISSGSQFQITSRMGPYFYDLNHNSIKKGEEHRKYNNFMNHATSKMYASQKNALPWNNNLKLSHLKDNLTRHTVNAPYGFERLQTNFNKLRDWFENSQKFSNRKIKKSAEKASFESQMLATKKIRKPGKVYRIPLSSLCRMFARRQKLVSGKATSTPTDDVYLNYDSDNAEKNVNVCTSSTEKEVSPRSFNSSYERYVDPYKFCSTLMPKSLSSTESTKAFLATENKLQTEVTKVSLTSPVLTQTTENSKSISSMSLLKLEDMKLVTKKRNGINLPATEPTTENVNSTMTTLTINSTSTNTTTFNSTTLNPTTLNVTSTNSSSNPITFNTSTLITKTLNLTTMNPTSLNSTTLSSNQVNTTLSSSVQTNTTGRACTCPTTVEVCPTKKKCTARITERCNCNEQYPTGVDICVSDSVEQTSTECDGHVVHPTVKIIFRHGGNCFSICNPYEEIDGLKYTLSVYKTTCKPNYIRKKAARRKPIVKNYFFGNRVFSMIENIDTTETNREYIPNNDEDSFNGLGVEGLTTDTSLTTDLLEIAKSLERRLKNIENKTLAVIARKKGKSFDPLKNRIPMDNRVVWPQIFLNRHSKLPIPASFIKSARKKVISFTGGRKMAPTGNDGVQMESSMLNRTEGSNYLTLGDNEHKETIDENTILRRLLSNENRFERQNRKKNIFGDSKSNENSNLKDKDKKVFWATLNPENGTNLILFYVVNKNATILPKEIDLKIQP